MKSEIQRIISEERLKDFSEIGAGWFWETDDTHHFTFVSGHFKEITGISVRNIINKTLQELSASEVHTSQFWKVYGTALQQQQPFDDLELTWKHCAGGTRTLQISGRPVFDKTGGFQGYRGIGRDITESRRVKAKLLAGDYFNRAVLDSITANIVVLDWQGEIIAANASWLQFGKDNGVSDGRLIDVGANYFRVCEKAVPDSRDAARCLVGMFAVLAGDQQSFEMEYSCDKPNQKHWILMRVIPLLTRDGGLVIVHTDITQHWLATEQQRLMIKAFENTADGIMITDAGQNLLWTNQAFENITGYSHAEIAGRTPDFLHSDQQNEAFYQQMWQALNTHDHWQGEVWNRHKNDTIYPEWLKISAMRDTTGNISHYVGVFSDITQLKKHENQLAFLAYHDPLTRLGNRTLFEQQLNKAIQRAERYQHNLGLLFIDLNGFKTVNDSLGHSMGDRLLQAVAQRLQAHIRVCDDLSRIGGDEFTILLHELSKPQAASIVAQKVLDTLAAPFQIERNMFYISASIGISYYPTDGKDADTLLKNADIAMYRAKTIQGGCFMFYSADMGRQANERLAVINDLRLALQRQEFILHYQPRLNLTTQFIPGVEALIRWQHPERGMVPPDLFIPLAEETGLIADIGEWVFKTACEQVKRWHNAGFEWLCVAVNLSAAQLRQPTLLQRLSDILTETGVGADSIELEITETAAMHDPAETSRLLNQLKAMGFDIAIDDFGTGYSSLSYLKRFPIDYLKIDRAFIKDLPDSKEDIAICEAIIALAESMNLHVIAEGVETAEQQEFLKHVNCHDIQGYLISRPVPAAELEKFLIDRQ